MELETSSMWCKHLQWGSKDLVLNSEIFTRLPRSFPKIILRSFLNHVHLPKVSPFSISGYTATSLYYTTSFVLTHLDLFVQALKNNQHYVLESNRHPEFRSYLECAQSFNQLLIPVNLAQGLDFTTTCLGMMKPPVMFWKLWFNQPSDAVPWQLRLQVLNNNTNHLG